MVGSNFQTPFRAPQVKEKGILQMRLTPEEGLTLASLMQTAEPLHPGISFAVFSFQQDV